MSRRVLLVAAVAAQLFLVHSAAAESVKFDISEFSIEGNTLLSLTDGKVQDALAPFIGKGRDMSDVNKAAEALRNLYHDAGYSVVQVVPPVQTVTSGKVILKVVEDKIVAIDVKGNSAYGADNIRASLPPLQMGGSLNANRLEAAIVLANENSAKQVAVNVRPGAQLGDINTRIDVTEDRITKFVTTLDNTGSSATGNGKLGFAYQNANLFDLDHALTLQYSGSPSSMGSTGSLSAGYHAPLYEYGLSMDLIAAYSSSTTQNGAIYFAGKGTVLGARLNYPLTSLGELRHKLIAGLDYKDTKNNFTACAGTCGSITERPVSIAYHAQMARPEFQGSGSISWVTNLTGGSKNGPLDYQNARPTVPGPFVATPNWDVWRINATGALPLPLDWQVRATVNGQYSKDLLIPAEQFGAGGITSNVRGYPERAVAGEKGYTANVELYTPDLNNYLGMDEGSLRALVFWDTGSVTVNDQYPAAMNINTTTNLYSYGLGVRLAYRKDLNLRADIGWAQRQVPFGAGLTRNNDVRGHFALSYIF